MSASECFASARILRFESVQDIGFSIMKGSVCVLMDTITRCRYRYVELSPRKDGSSTREVTDIIEAWDHRFLVERGDPLVEAFDQSGDEDSLVVLDHPPTAEVMSLLLEQRPDFAE